MAFTNGAKSWSTTRVSVTPLNRVIEHIVSATDWMVLLVLSPSLLTQQTKALSSAKCQGK